MNHHCTFEDLPMITIYTPKLQHLYFINEKELNNSIRDIILPIPLCSLTHLTVRDYYKNFNEFEIFISHLNLKLKVLFITVKFQDITYLNAFHWEEFIRKHLPQLKKCYLNHFEGIQFPINPQQLNQFSSIFWIKRQWIMEIQFADGYTTHLIRPYRKTWFLDSSFIQLTLIYYSDRFGGIRTIDRRHFLSTIQIYDLKISDENIFAGDTCQITKVYLEKATEIEEVYLLMKLYPWLTICQSWLH
ncbi:unnamed protein product [Adineta steineri]|uniref:Uncharacterized protein n=1 Tax=Adineta steineri TaxID=433720 RepID=A0A815RXT7_9BILA|nr:unnamed protein product [Adineta steineri]CAF1483358.1 unnamed protein product [Adineta steineri]CAF1639189.1 unnamed protein product [Adineta steineri]CAF1639204.1 unnamed protein product [Adineta steineri]